MYDFLVVGGGVVGLSLAWELAQRKQRVCVVDRQETGRATSRVGAGIFPPPKSGAIHDPLEQLRTQSHALHVEWSQRLLAETGVDNELRRCGGVYLARQVGEAAALRVEMLQAAEDGVQSEALSRQSLVEREPKLVSIADDVLAAYYLPDEMQLRSPPHLRALRAACEKVGVEFRIHVEVSRLEMKSEKVAALQTNQGLLTANKYCICSGPWSAQLLEPLGVCLPVEPWRGQLLLWKTPQPLVSHVINEGFRYLVPRADGYLLAGATVEDVGFDCQTTDEAVTELREFSERLLPELGERKYEMAMSGLRPKTPDGLPFMDHVPGVANLSISTGHYRSGLHLSPICAVFMAGLLLDDIAAIVPNPFRLNR